MRVLIGYASKHGATLGIAERIGTTLREMGVDTDVRDVTDAGNPDAYAAVVVCSAVYYGHWLKPATDFVRTHTDELAASRVWLCSSGPLGDKPLPEPVEIAEFESTIAPVEHVSFGGALDSNKLGLAERLVAKGVRAPRGDFRDWAAIDVWASGIAGYLKSRGSPC